MQPNVVSTEQGEQQQTLAVEREEEDHGLLDNVQNKKAFVHPLLLKHVSLVVLVLQNTCHVLVTRYALTRDRQSHPPFSKSVAVFFNELIKLSTSLTLFFISTNDLRKSFQLLHHHFVSNCMDTLKVGVPAFCYLIQNILVFLALENLESGTFMVTYQLKILTTAVFSVLLLKRRLSIPQWTALLILIAGIALVQYCSKQKCELALLKSNASTVSVSMNMTSTVRSNVPGKMQQNSFLGFACVFFACFLSGFSGIYFEKILKGSEVSIWLHNVQLSLLSLPLAVVIIAVHDGPKTLLGERFIQGFNGVVWVSVLLQAIGGLVVAVVIKYADNILKAFATSVAIVVATIASILLLNTEPKLMFFVGASLVIAAVVVYGVFPYRTKDDEILKRKECKEKNGEEMQVIVRSGERRQKQRGEEGQAEGADDAAK